MSDTPKASKPADFVPSSEATVPALAEVLAKRGTVTTDRVLSPAEIAQLHNATKDRSR